MNLVSTSYLRTCYAALEKAVPEAIDECDRIGEAESKNLAALAGGYTADGDKAKIKSCAASRRADVCRAVDELAAETESKMLGYVNDRLSIKPEVLAPWLGVFGNVELPDSDLRRIACDNPDYSMLRAVASNGMRRDSAFAGALDSRLDDYCDGVRQTVSKLLDAATKAVAEIPRKGSVFNRRNLWREGASEALFADLDKMNADFDAFLVGSTGLSVRDVLKEAMNRG